MSLDLAGGDQYGIRQLTIKPDHTCFNHTDRVKIYNLLTPVLPPYILSVIQAKQAQRTIQGIATFPNTRRSPNQEGPVLTTTKTPHGRSQRKDQRLCSQQAADQNKNNSKAMRKLKKSRPSKPPEVI